MDGEIKGQGTARYPNGSVYTGAFDKGQPQGRGKITFADGGTYDGDWVMGKMTGQGPRPTRTARATPAASRTASITAAAC